MYAHGLGCIGRARAGRDAGVRAGCMCAAGEHAQGTGEHEAAGLVGRRWSGSYLVCIYLASVRASGCVELQAGWHAGRDVCW